MCDYYQYKSCKGNFCKTKKSCEICIESPSCGWCNDRENFIEGCIEKSKSFRGCPQDSWFHSRSEYLNNCSKKNKNPIQPDY